ncbi:phage virion morphogenesis protein [Sediminispirochaeta bajacaliforniensis]|uniref:phage virion morphogenesis protein n=1 Tax=Sediminispirochaeta bajacaliforniensis TaxID=148 RepID=UPI000379A163|nr:phage virion morphogenesis protein [Sediminispirochaeta bajacaliforniensis]
MAAAAVSFDVRDIEKLADRLSSLNLDGGNRRALLMALGTELEAQTVERFETKKAPDGTPWKALNERYQSYLAEKFPYARPQLVVSGELRDTIESQVGSWNVLAGATKIYAARQNFGYENKTSARQFVGIGPQDETDLLGILEDFIEQRIIEAAS